MAKGQKRSGREPKKPKASKKTVAPTGSSSTLVPPKRPAPKSSAS